MTPIEYILAFFCMVVIAALVVTVVEAAIKAMIEIIDREEEEKAVAEKETARAKILKRLNTFAAVDVRWYGKEE